MSTFAENVMDDLKIAMKAKDSVALTTLRALKTALTNAAIESGNKDNVIAQADALAIVRKQIKQRNDSIEQFENAGRSELAEKEKAEIVVLEKYLPAAMSPEEVSAIVAAAVSELEPVAVPKWERSWVLYKERPPDAWTVRPCHKK